MILASFWALSPLRSCCSLTVPGGHAGSVYLSVMAAMGNDVEKCADGWTNRLFSSVHGQRFSICNYLLLGVLAVPSQSVYLINAIACRACKLAGQEAPAVDSCTQIPDFQPMYLLYAPSGSVELSNRIAPVYQCLSPPSHSSNSHWCPPG